MSGLTNPSPATNLKFDASNNVLANINAQNINPNANTLNTYLPSLLSHQTGLSGTPASAFTPVNVGNSITVPRAGLILMSLKGHVSADEGVIDYTLTRNGIVYYAWQINASNHTSTVLGNANILDSLYGDTSIYENYLISTTSVNLTRCTFTGSSGASNGVPNNDFIPVLNGDVIQLRVSNNAASSTTYIDDLEVLLL